MSVWQVRKEGSAEVYALPSSSCACIWRRPTLPLIVVNVAVPDWPLIPGATVTR